MSARDARTVIRKTCARYNRTSSSGVHRSRVIMRTQTPELLSDHRNGPDLTNIGARQPSTTWQYIHLWEPRAVVHDSIMPRYPWLFDVKSHAGPGDEVVPLPPGFRAEQRGSRDDRAVSRSRHVPQSAQASAAARRTGEMSTALGWIVIAVGTIATAATVVAAAYWTVRPGERDPRHPKYMILRRDR